MSGQGDTAGIENTHKMMVRELCCCLPGPGRRVLQSKSSFVFPWPKRCLSFSICFYDFSRGRGRHYSTRYNPFTITRDQVLVSIFKKKKNTNIRYEQKL